MDSSNGAGMANSKAVITAAKIIFASADMSKQTPSIELSDALTTTSDNPSMDHTPAKMLMSIPSYTSSSSFSHPDAVIDVLDDV
jgi:hypothetical protein